MTKQSQFIIAIILLAAHAGIGGTSAVADRAMPHPLDPLNTGEYLAVISVLGKEGRVNADTRYPLITLREPTKEDVLSWQPGDRISRHGFVIVKDGRKTFEAVIDINARKLLVWNEIEGVQPGILMTDEWLAAQQIVKADSKWQAIIHQRGIKNIQDVVCVPHTIGNFGAAHETQNRLVNVTCFDSHETDNYWAHPIEGVIARVDLNQRKVIGITDTGKVPVPDAPAGLDVTPAGSSRKPLHEITLSQAEGPGFRVNGHVVDWQKWRFHFRIDPRLGPVVSLVQYNDKGRLRSILYQGSLSELFVPYMDPDAGWYFKGYMDAGEYGIGKLAVPLKPGQDCPANAVFFNVVFAGDEGYPYAQPNVACLFERSAGGIAWRHFERVNGSNEVRKRTDLVLRFITAVGNYDYLFDWVFRQDGTIRIDVGATGIEQVKGVRSRTIKDDDSRQDTAYGHMVAEHTVAVNHDHFFNFRLDLDVDGRRNGLLIDRLKPRDTAGQGPRKSIWVVDSKMAATEQDARLRIDLEHPALWRVINPRVKGPLGYPVSYQLKPGTNAVSLLDPEDQLQQRAGFTDYHLWVTPYKPDERYAAGTYPNQSRGGDGLPGWTNSNRKIDDTDVVLWYTLGFHHVVRAEDWPVLPMSRHGFELRPFDFFKQNPALDLPEK